MMLEHKAEVIVILRETLWVDFHEYSVLSIGLNWSRKDLNIIIFISGYEAAMESRSAKSHVLLSLAVE